MTHNILNIRQDTPLDKGKAIVYWLGGSGFSFKFATGEIICIDPYFSDCVEEMAGFRRLSLAPLKANELAVDLFLLSHEHPDHLDPKSFNTIISSNPSCKVLASVDCTDFLKEKKVDYQLAAPGDVLKFGKIIVKCVSADHGKYSPGALGFLIEFSGRTLYFTGDTGLNEKRLADPIAAKPEIVIPCINGAFGNLMKAVLCL